MEAAQDELADRQLPSLLRESLANYLIYTSLGQIPSSLLPRHPPRNFYPYPASYLPFA